MNNHFIGFIINTDQSVNRFSINLHIENGFTLILLYVCAPQTIWETSVRPYVRELNIAFFYSKFFCCCHSFLWVRRVNIASNGIWVQEKTLVLKRERETHTIFSSSYNAFVCIYGAHDDREIEREILLWTRDAFGMLFLCKIGMVTVSKKKKNLEKSAK